MSAAVADYETAIIDAPRIERRYALNAQRAVEETAAGGGIGYVDDYGRASPAIIGRSASEMTTRSAVH
jgi:hypothetical protein